MNTDRLHEKHDMILIGAWVCLVFLGILMIFSASAAKAEHFWQAYWFKQLIHLSVGTVAFLIFSFMHPNTFRAISYPFYFISVGMLLFLAVGGGHLSHGAGRWISIGGFNFQPSEMAKIAYLMVMADIMQGRRLGFHNLEAFAKPLLFFAVPFVLILKQPNLSTALVFLVITLSFFFWNGLKLREIFVILSPLVSVISSTNAWAWYCFIALAVFVLWINRLPRFWFVVLLCFNILAGYGSSFMWSHLENHQRSRIMVFLDPMMDPRGQGYQVIQSQLAIGSGGITGKGFRQGTQVNLDFLPEDHTDFIFSVLGEQFGFAGCLFVLLLIWTMIFRLYRMCATRNHPYGNYLVIGVASILAFHSVVNIAMTMGMMPVTGLPLPFFSYGGTFLITCMIMMGMVFSVRYKGGEL